MKVELTARNEELRGEAEKLGGKVNGKSIVVIRQAAETGQLYGSVSTRDIAELLGADGFIVTRGQIALNAPIKAIGMHKVPLLLHPEVEVSVTVTVARSADEAQRLARGEDITIRRDEGADEETPPAVAEEAFFEPEVVEARQAREAKAEEAEEPQK
jgi:large subunit ribosomal protein L9